MRPTSLPAGSCIFSSLFRMDGNDWLANRATGSSGRRAGFDRHAFIREPTSPEQVRHAAHGGIDVVEERPVSSAQIVQAGLAVRRLGKAVARAFAIAGKQHLAVATVFWQRIELVAAELALSRRHHELGERRFTDV